jgi:hypothetical protein
VRYKAVGFKAEGKRQRHKLSVLRLFENRYIYIHLLINRFQPVETGFAMLAQTFSSGWALQIVSVDEGILKVRQSQD